MHTLHRSVSYTVTEAKNTEHRFCVTRKAVKEICEPALGEFTSLILKWSGPNGTLIVVGGPLQEIKKELKRRTDSGVPIDMGVWNVVGP
jgi:hypothetical protein